MDKYGYLAESMIPPRENTLKKIDVMHMLIEDVHTSQDMVIITHNLLSNVTAIVRRQGGETGGAEVLVDQDVLQDTAELLYAALGEVHPENSTTLAVLRAYEEVLATRRSGEGFVEGDLSTLSMASHLLLEAHRSIFESNSFVSGRAASSVKVLNSIQQAYWVASQTDSQA